MDPKPLSLDPEPGPSGKPPNGQDNFKGWMERSGLPGKLLAGGALLGIICAFLPIVSLSIGHITISALMIDAWQGVISLIAYVACGAAAWLLFQPVKSPQYTNLRMAMLIAAGLAALLGLWIVILARHAIGIGAILNLPAAAAVAVGAVLKAKEDRLF